MTKLAHVQISLDFSDSKSHYFNVTMTFSGLKDQQLSMPAWTPGSYMIRDFAQHIVGIKAWEQGQSVPVVKVSKNTFQIKNQHPELKLSYQVYAFDSSIRAAFIDDSQAFFNGTALFLCPEGLENAVYVLNLAKKDEISRVATTLHPIEVDERGFGSFSAQGFHELVDHPVQISKMQRLCFSAGGLPHAIALVGDVRNFDCDRLITDLTKICEAHLKLFGSAPFKSYLFIARFEEGGYGGLEHRSSTMVLHSPYGLPKKGLKEPDSSYRSFLSLCSHEYFHAWNVKELKPHEFVTMDLERECYTTMLWAFEGITAYYDELMVKRADIISQGTYLDVLSKEYSRLLKTPGRLVQSLADASFDAWIKFYHPHENSPNTTVSYYLKGSILALYLDLTIRLFSKSQASLDDVMRMAVSRYGKSGIKEAEFFALFHEIGGIEPATMAKWVTGTEDLPLKELLRSFGVESHLAKDEYYIDEKLKMSAYLGIKIRFNHSSYVISFVDREGPSMVAGLSPLDEIIALNNIRLDQSNASELLGAIGVDETVDILYSRKKMIKHSKITAKELPIKICKFSLKSKMDLEEKNRLEKWLEPNIVNT